MDSAIRLGITGETADAIRSLARRADLKPEAVAQALLETGLRNVRRALGAPRTYQPPRASVIDLAPMIAERRAAIEAACMRGDDV